MFIPEEDLPPLRPVPGIERLYISPNLEFYHDSSRGWTKVTPKQNWMTSGTYYIQFNERSYHRKLSVAKLVYRTFVGPVDRWDRIRHVNGDVADWHPFNLERTKGESKRRFYKYPGVIDYPTWRERHETEDYYKALQILKGVKS